MNILGNKQNNEDISLMHHQCSPAEVLIGITADIILCQAEEVELTIISKFECTFIYFLIFTSVQRKGLKD